MRLDHLDLPVPDVTATSGFFIRHFGFRLRRMPGTAHRAILDGDGTTLVISQRRPGDGGFPRDFHVGFYLESREELDACHERLLAEGAPVKAPRAMRGGWTMYLDAPGGFLVEVSWIPVEGSLP